MSEPIDEATTWLPDPIRDPGLSSAIASLISHFNLKLASTHTVRGLIRERWARDPWSRPEIGDLVISPYAAHNRNPGQAAIEIEHILDDEIAVLRTKDAGPVMQRFEFVPLDDLLVVERPGVEQHYADAAAEIYEELRDLDDEPDHDHEQNLLDLITETEAEDK